jgi:hypothetical protein
MAMTRMSSMRVKAEERRAWSVERGACREGIGEEQHSSERLPGEESCKRVNMELL